MKKHLPFVFYSIFSTIAVIIAIYLPRILEGCVQNNDLRLTLGAVSGVIISITGSWFTYYQTNKAIEKANKETAKIKDTFQMTENEDGSLNATIDGGTY